MLIEGSSVAPDNIRRRARRDPARGSASLVMLDSNHSRAHVAAELALYAPLVTPGSYIVACDGIMAQVAPAPRGNAPNGLEQPGFRDRRLPLGHR